MNSRFKISIRKLHSMYIPSRLQYLDNHMRRVDDRDQNALLYFPKGYISIQLSFPVGFQSNRNQEQRMAYLMFNVAEYVMIFQLTPQLYLSGFEKLEQKKIPKYHHLEYVYFSEKIMLQQKYTFDQLVKLELRFIILETSETF